MKLRIVAVGKLKERDTRALCDDYLGRLRRYGGVDEIEIDPRHKDVAGRLAKACQGALVVALDVAGKAYDSRGLARQLERWRSSGKGAVAFLIGGADGLPRAVLDGADARWSLSPLTFPHRLARVLVAEQLYRAMTILRGEPYDH